MATIINKDDIAGYIPLATNLDETRVNLYAAEQEKLRLTKILGRAFYADLIEHTSNYTDLITKIKPVLVYWTYVMYFKAGRVFNTAAGIAVKRSDYSMPVDEKEAKDIIEANIEMARFYESELLEYLEANKDSFPLYLYTPEHTGQAVFSIKTTGI